MSGNVNSAASLSLGLIGGGPSRPFHHPQSGQAGCKVPAGPGAAPPSASDQPPELQSWVARVWLKRSTGTSPVENTTQPTLLCQLMQGAGDGGETPDKPSVIGGKPQEAPYLTGSGRCRPVPDFSHLGWISGHPVCTDHVPQECSFSGQQVALCRVQPEPSLAVDGEDLPEIGEHTLEVSGLHQSQNIWHAPVWCLGTPHSGSGECPSAFTHEALKGVGSISHSKQHDLELPKSLAAGEGCFG